jgi:hypothetical protein
MSTVTVFTKLPHASDPTGSSLSKRIEIGPDGRPVADGSPCRMVAGTAFNASAPDAGALAGLIDAMLSSNALALGTIVNANTLTVKLLTASALASLTPQQRGNDTIARTREYIQFRQRETAWCLIDYDA